MLRASELSLKDHCFSFFVNRKGNRYYNKWMGYNTKVEEFWQQKVIFNTDLVFSRWKGLKTDKSLWSDRSNYTFLTI